MSEWSAEGLGKWQIVAIIAVPITLACFLGIVGSLIYFVRKWNSPSIRYHYSESRNAPDEQPILGVTSLRDIMNDLTTSGSGSG